MPKPWYIDLLTFMLVGLWMLGTFVVIQSNGPSLTLVASAVVVALIGILVIYGQRLRFLKIGDRIELGLRTPEDYSRDDGGDE